MGKMTIAHTLATLQIAASGVCQAVLGLGRAQAEAGAWVQLHSPGGKSIFSGHRIVDVRHAPDHAIPCISVKLGGSLALRRALRNPQIDVIHTHGLWRLVNTYTGAPQSDAPLVISPHGMLAPEALRKTPAMKWFFRRLFQDAAFRNAAMFQASAESEYEAIRKFGVRQPVAVIPHGIDIPNVLPPRNTFKSSQRTLLSLGRLAPIKGLDFLLHAWAAVETSFPDWNLRIVGPDEGGYAGELKRLAASLRLKRATIEPPAYESAKTDLMASAALFVLPSKTENFAMTVAESLAVGVPVIASKGAPWSRLELLRCGWWIDLSVESLKAALVQAMALRDEDRLEMGARGREWMIEEFSWGRVGDMSLAACAWIANRGPRPAWVRLS
jgi:glycosyltransferase involved in cell wall biosynthesis